MPSVAPLPLGEGPSGDKGLRGGEGEGVPFGQSVSLDCRARYDSVERDDDSMNGQLTRPPGRDNLTLDLLTQLGRLSPIMQG